MVINWIDVGILGSIGFSTIMGAVRGFAKEAISLATWLAAMVIGLLYCQPVSVYFSFVGIEVLRIIFAFLSLALMTMVVGGFINYFMGKMVTATGFSTTDKLIGFFFGIFRGALAIAIMLVFMEGNVSELLEQNAVFKESGLLPHFQEMAKHVKSWIPANILDKAQQYLFPR
ncbi:MAG: CvpA family protein [Gammaproteobacteria bacterium]